MFRPNFKTAIGALLTVLLGLSAVAFGQRGPAEFTMRSVDGQNVTAQGLRGEVVVLAFGASWLPLSRTQLQGIKKLADEYSGRALVVFFVSTDSENPKSKNFATDEQLRTFSQKYGLKVPVLRDPDGQVSRSFGIDQLPAIVILDKAGNQSGEAIKGLDPDGNLARQLAERLDRVL